MAKQSFLLVSLKEDKAKELAQVISNESCRKILDYLAEHEDATETEISKKLDLPISTVHYNLQNLVNSGVIIAEEFHYSKKGKEVNHYKLANKYIIIAPKTTFGIKEKLRSILPVSLLALAGAGFIQLYARYSGFGSAPLMKSVPEVFSAMEPMMEKAEGDVARAAVDKVPEAVQQAIQAAPNYALWFLFGALFVIVLVVVFELIKKRK